MGTGKVAMQSFLECRSRCHVIGIELSSSRYALAVNAASKLAAATGDRFELCTKQHGLTLLETMTGRQLEFMNGDLCSLPAAVMQVAGIVFLQVVLPETLAGCRSLGLLRRGTASSST